MKTNSEHPGVSVKIPKPLYDLIRKRANEHGRTIVGQLRIMLRVKA
jgi:hypothetical protein